ncbi:DNA polymerase III subunit psi [Vibrio sp. SCSIO 43140]|uniref:DNA polymerase III subunit psi n=1 Tax=Vibrio sp. SCSIO 43140 TaxID=2819100 RepID=UPI002075AC41|nr:DNA polymerase III subunit psi [Vibrio sp. SCSIO 43140]USD59909.1 DNA polymerase III subunit psi [Vibrio sp. SCSIO 43140]
MHNSTTLQLMGIQTWELTHPERMPNSAQATFSLAPSCQLLFVSAVKPEGELVSFFEKILKAMKLELDSVLHITPEQLGQLDAQSVPTWMWFAGDEHAADRFEHWLQLLDIPSKPKFLQSSYLAEIEGDDSQKRQLWNQIRAYN